MNDSGLYDDYKLIVSFFQVFDYLVISGICSRTDTAV